MKAILIFLLCCLGALATAQDSVFLTFPDTSPREIWIQTGLPSAAPEDSTRTEQTSLDLTIKGKKPTDAVFIWDKKKGNLASKTVKDLQSAGQWKLQDSDFQDIAEVAVQVQHDGNPVSAAIVTLTDPRRRQQEFLDPSNKGEVRFFAVKPGPLKVKVQYKSDGKDAPPLTQILDTSLNRNDAVPSLKISLPEPVEVLSGDGPPTPTAKTGEKGAVSKKEEAAPSANPLGTMIGYLIGIGIAVAAAWFLIQYFKKNPETVGSKLEQLGVQIPKPQDDALTSADPVAPVAPAKPAPPQKIMLDDAAPSPLGSSVPTAAPVLTGQPKLISDTGDEMQLADGETTVGREVGLGLSLIGESTVSRRHAVLTRKGDAVTVKDLGSTNGTYVNGAKIDGEATLRPGDSVQFGSVRFQYQG